MTVALLGAAMVVALGAAHGVATAAGRESVAQPSLPEAARDAHEHGRAVEQLGERTADALSALEGRDARARPAPVTLEQVAADLVIPSLAAWPGLSILNPPAHTFQVDSTSDLVDANPGDGTCAAALGVCTLRAAVMESNASAGWDRIVLDDEAYLLGLASFANDSAAGGDLQVTGHAEIRGIVGGATVVDADSADSGPHQRRVFDVADGARLDLRDLDVTGGSADNGGGIRNAGVLNLRRVEVRDNFAYHRGGGIQTAGTATLIDSSVHDNTLDDVPTRNIRTNAFAGRGGGIDNIPASLANYLDTTLRLTRSTVSHNDGNVGGGVFNGARLLAENATISNNGWGGGIANVGFTVVNNTTIADNHSVDYDPSPQDPSKPKEVGGGVTSYGPKQLFVLRNTIIGDNEATAGLNEHDDCSIEPLASDGYNLVEDTDCDTLHNAATTTVGVDPEISGLTFWGGSTRTHRLQATSPAIDAGYPYNPGGPAAKACAGTDQRGVVRIVCDIGAYEVEVTVPDGFTIDNSFDVADTAPGDGQCHVPTGHCTLRAAVMEANALPGVQTITLPAGMFTLTSHGTGEDAAATGDLDLTDDVVLAGAGEQATFLDGDDADRVLDLDLGVSATIQDLTVRNGTAPSGGAIRTAGDLTATQVRIRDSDATYGGGISVGSSGSLALTDARLLANSADFHGGGIDVSGNAVVDVTSSIVRNNSAGLSGGGIHGGTNTSVTTSTIRGNSAQRGGGIAGVASLTRSLLRDNTASLNGGGLLTVFTTELVNSTFSGNMAGDGAGISSSGTLSATHVTITNGTGGGVQTFGSTASTSLHNTIVSGNAGDDCQAKAVTSHGDNLLGPSCAAVPSDVIAGNPALSPLGDFGGPTLTHRPHHGSPARNGATGAGVGVDQRGQARPKGPAFDIGAFERG